MWRFIVLAYLIRGLTGHKEHFGVRKEKNPEADMDVSQMISHHGYPCEKHEVWTDDDYCLTMYRIPHGREDNGVIGSKPAVFMQHGSLGDASHWVQNMPSNSLGFVLADKGYDVWLGNSRGTSYSLKHRNFSVDQREFWDFSFHEMAMYDLPASICYILKESKQQQLHYIGHSQGSTIGLIAFSAMPEVAKKIKTFNALAPMIHTYHFSNHLLKHLAIHHQTDYMKILGDKDLTYTHGPMKDYRKKICEKDLFNIVCPCLFFIPDTYTTSNLNMSRMDVYAAHYPDRTSVKCILHWGQILESGQFRHFDYGEEKNKKMYNQSVPPSYQIGNMNVPTTVWSGGRDTLADPRDVDHLRSHINRNNKENKHVAFHYSQSNLNHMDMIFGCNLHDNMFRKIMKRMEK